MDYATSDVTATAPADYTAATGTLTFAPGVTTQTVPVTVQGDLSDEANETYRVTLSNPTNVTIATAIGTGTITDNDAPPSIVDQRRVASGGQRRDDEHELRRVAVGPQRPDRDRQLRDRELDRRPARRLHDDLRDPHVHPGSGDEDDLGADRRRHDRRVRRDVLRQPVRSHERLDRRPSGRGDHRGRRPPAVAHDQRRLAHGGRRRDGQHDVHRDACRR